MRVRKIRRTTGGQMSGKISAKVAMKTMARILAPSA